MKDDGCKMAVKHDKWDKACNNRVNRLRDQYWDFPPTVDIERAKVYTRVYKENEAEDVIVKKALAFKTYFEERTIEIFKDELVVGTLGKEPRSAVICPDICWEWTKKELDTMDKRPQDPYAISNNDREILRNEIFPYWEQGKSMEDYFLAHATDEIKNISYQTNIVFPDNNTAAGAGETSADFEKILTKGFKAIKAEAQSKLDELDSENITLYDKKQFYNAILLTCDAIHILSERYADKAEKMAEGESDESRKEELLEIARICRKVPWEPAETYHEAIQAMWFVQIMLYTEETAAAYCMPRIDYVLNPYYERDVKNGIITEERALELMECLWIKLAEVLYVYSEGAAKFYAGYVPFHGVTLGGVDREGNDSVNKVSFMGLQATIDLQMHAPSVNVRINKVTGEEFLNKLCELIECGTGQPAILFDETVFESLRKQGIKEEDIWNYNVSGCITGQIGGKTTQWNEGGRYAYPIAVDFALNNGYSHVLRRQVGLKTGDPRLFKTYEEFEEAVVSQLRYVIKMACLTCQIGERAQKLLAPKPFRASVIEGCIESGREIMEGGAKYNTGPGMLATGVADYADSMAAIKKLVYENKILTMDEVLEALENNFEGYDITRQILINKAPKFGNDEPYVDEIAKKIVKLSCDFVAEHTSIWGTPYINGIVPVMANAPHGLAIWALPSGRKAQEPLADGMSPFPGYDKNGPTAVVNSVCKVDHSDNPPGVLLNLKITPDMLKDDEGRKKLIALLRAEEVLGGYHVQFNVTNRETLLAAQKEPEKYADLLVRVAGYSAFFVDLSKEAQEIIIARTQQTAW